MDTRDLIQIIAGVKPKFSPEQVCDYTMFFEKPESLSKDKRKDISSDLHIVMSDMSSKDPEFAKQLRSALDNNPNAGYSQEGLLAKEAYEDAIRSDFKSRFKKAVRKELGRKPFPDSETNFNFPRFDISGWSELEVVVDPMRYKPSATDPASAPKVEVKAAITLKNPLEIEAVRETKDDSEYIDKVVDNEQWTAYVNSTMRASYYFDINSGKIETIKFYKDPEIKLSFGRQRSTEQIEEAFFAGRPLPTLMGLAGLVGGVVLPIWYLIEKDSAEGFLATPIGIALGIAWHVLNKKYRKQDKRKLGSIIAKEHYDRKVPL